MFLQSLPVRERGLKYQKNQYLKQIHYVAPCAGAWIEIFCTAGLACARPVAPCAGAWIEIEEENL